MRSLTIAVIVLALTYSGYWFVGATAVERGVRGGFADLAAQGWDVTYRDLDTRGYPSRFDTFVDGLQMTAPGGSFSYRTPFVQTFALSYQPNRMILALPAEQVFDLGPEQIVLQADGLRASGAAGANPALSLDTVAAEVGQAVLTSSNGWELALDRAVLALRETGPAQFSYDAYVDVDGLVLPMVLRQWLDPIQRHPDGVTKLTANATVILDRALDRHSLSDWQTTAPRITNFKINNMALQWGKMSVTGDGDITIGADGRPEGQITLRALEWREMINLLRNLGTVQPGIISMVEGMANVMSNGQPELDLPIKFTNGQMSLGPVPLGPAPQFY